MAEFIAPTRNQPVQAAPGYHLWKYRSYPVEQIVWIADADDAVTQTESPMDKHLNQDAKAGSGENGKAVFRYGKQYQISASEETILEAAGYTILGD